MERAITDREIFIAEFEDEIYKTKGVSEDLENVLKEYQSDDHDLSQVLETLNNALELNSQIQFFIQERKDEVKNLLQKESAGFGAFVDPSKDPWRF